MTEVSSSTTTDMPSSGAPSELDLAFIIDATGSMGSYIHAAQENMKNIIHNIITSEKCLLNVALILYRDHPPQDSSFIIQVHNFTDDAEEAKANIDKAAASGGGDGPEAVAPALHAAVHTLSWRTNAVKIALLIADAPPHGLDLAGDGFPDGDPSGHDPIESVALLAEHSITLYTIGCEPAATPYRDFYMALAFKTGGQYIPLASCANLASIIVGSAKEEISLERLLAQVHEEVMQEAALRGGAVDEIELTRRIHEVMHGGGAKARRVKMENQDGTNSIPSITPAAEHLSTLTTLREVQQKWVRYTDTVTAAATTTFGGLVGLGLKTTPPGPRLARKKRGMPAVVAKKKAPTKRKLPTKVKPIIKKKARLASARGSRKSTRLAFSNTDAKEEEEFSDNEAMETTAAALTPPPPPPPPPLPSSPVKKPAKLKTEVSNISLQEDELLDISQTRRLVRKCVARNKLKST